MYAPRSTYPVFLISFLLFLVTGPPLFAREEELSIAPELRLDTEALRRNITGEARSELLSLSLGDTDVSLFLAGSWKATLSGNAGIALTPLGLTLTSAESPILFTQEADLSLSLWLRRRWFVEANVLDDYHLNTYRAGYQGGPGEAVRYIGIGNTGLDYPAFPYLDLGGDSPYTFGAYGRFGSGPLTFHSLIRYDAAAREERVFVGNRERTYSYLSVVSPLRGLSFVLPQDMLPAVPEVYLEDPKGAIPGSDGRRWRLAGPGEYAASARYGILELSAPPAGRVAVAYPGIALGTYGGAGFLGDAQAFFGDLRLIEYPQPGQDDPSLLGQAHNTPGMVTLANGGGGITALVIYEQGSFSPFERQSRYQAPTSNAAEAALVRVSSGDPIRDYELQGVEAITSAPTAPPLTPVEIKRGVFELIKAGLAPDIRDPRGRWPLGRDYPALYAPGNKGFTEDMAIRFTNYEGTGGYSLGTDVIPGSVQVYRGGLLDPQVSFNSASGMVELQNPAMLNEVIRIRYLKKHEERQFGSLAAGIGAVYGGEGPFSGEAALGIRWNLNAGSYSEYGKTSPGIVGMGSKAALEFDTLKAQVSLGLNYEQPDTAGLYRVAGMEGAEFTLSLPVSASFIAVPPADYLGPGVSFSGLTQDNRADLIYRDYQKRDILGASIGGIESNGPVVPGQTGPYPVTDAAVSQDVLLAAEFALGNGKTWTGFQVPLGIEGSLLEQAQEIAVPFRFYGFDPLVPGSGSPRVRVLIQLGALGDPDTADRENPSLIAAREIYPAHYEDAGDARKIGRIILTDEDRRRLQGARYLRVVILREEADDVNGRFLLAAPVVTGAGFRPIVVTDTTIKAAPDQGGLKSVSAVEKIDAALGGRYGDMLNKLHPGGAIQRTLEVAWNNLDNGEAPGADGRTGAIPLSKYQVLSFFFKAPQPPLSAAEPANFQNAALRVLIGRGPDALNAPDQDLALEARIPLAQFKAGEWSKIEIRYNGGETGISADGNGIPQSAARYRADVLERTGAYSGVPGAEGEQAAYAAFFIENHGAALPAGSFSLDEIILETSSPVYGLNAGAAVAWAHPGALIAFQNRPILGDITLRAALEGVVQGDPFTNPAGKPSYGTVTRSYGELTLLGARLQGNYSLSAAPNALFWNGGHELSRSWGPFRFHELFALSPDDKALTHRLDLNLAGPIRSRLTGTARYTDTKFERYWQASALVEPGPDRVLGASIEGNALLSKPGEGPAGLDRYAEAWLNSWKPLLPDSGRDAQNRQFQGILKVPLALKPVGIEFSADGAAGFSAPANTARSETLGRLDFPFAFGEYQGLLRGERSFKRSVFYPSADALEDGSRYYESLWDSRNLWVSLPFYSLFAPALEDTMENALSEAAAADITEYGRFTDAFQVSLRLPDAFGLKTLWIPRHIETKLSRNLERKLDTRLDVFTIASALTFNSVNLWGAFGYMPVFSFYQDEFTHRLEGSLALPRNDALTWRFQDELLLSIYGFTGAEFTLTNTLTLTADSRVESLEIAWTAPAPQSLLGILYIWLSDKARDMSAWPALSHLANTAFERLRKETLEATIESSQDVLRTAFTLGHESIIRILGRFNWSVFAKLSCAQYYDSPVYSFTGAIGTSLQVSF